MKVHTVSGTVYEKKEGKWYRNGSPFKCKIVGSVGSYTPLGGSTPFLSAAVPEFIPGHRLVADMGYDTWMSTAISYVERDEGELEKKVKSE